MLDRLTASPHFATFVGVFVATLALFAALCFVVGVAVVLDVIVGAIR